MSDGMDMFFEEEGGPEKNLEEVVEEVSSEFVNEVRSILSFFLRDLVEAGKQDLGAFATDMARELAKAIKAGDDGSIRELKEQAKLLSEVHRIRVVNASGDVLAGIMGALGTGFAHMAKIGVLTLN